ncbi:STAS domain-containing protein [Streptomyces sp. NPDC012888]|uniref:STAS domain-containing protein n=1 Tax=Streptomyces sp. NPDC012888 TaxID=3364855 RepID=UPI0036875412
MGVELRVYIGSGTGPLRMIRCTGDIDHDSAGRLEEAGRQALTQPGGEFLVIDVAGVTFMDSAGLNCLRRLAPVSLADPLPHRIARLLQLTGADQVFPMTDEAGEGREA